MPAQLEAYQKAIEINPGFAEGHLFLAKLYLDLNRRWTRRPGSRARASSSTRPRNIAPLGHYVMADVYAREGRAAESAHQAALGRALEARLKQRGTRARAGSAMR